MMDTTTKATWKEITTSRHNPSLREVAHLNLTQKTSKQKLTWRHAGSRSLTGWCSAGFITQLMPMLLGVVPQTVGLDHQYQHRSRQSPMDVEQTDIGSPQEFFSSYVTPGLVKLRIKTNLQLMMEISLSFWNSRRDRNECVFCFGL